MTNKFYLLLASLVFMCFLFSPTGTLPLLAQEEQKAEDIEDFSLEDLLNVEITTAGKAAEKISEIPASVVLITRGEIEKYGYHSLQEILENVPGFFTIDQKAHVDVTLGVRGFWGPSNKGVVILVNGVSQYQDIYGHYPLNKVAVPPEAIDRIEVVRGPMSVVYGSGAFFGAINIITNETKNSPNVASIGYGTQNSPSVFFRKTGGTDDFSFSVNGGYTKTDGNDVPWSKMSSSPYFGDAKTDDFFWKSTYFFNLSSSYKGFYSDFSIIRAHDVWEFMVVDMSNPNRKRSDFANAKIGYRADVTKKLNLDLKFGYYMTNVQSGNTWPHSADQTWLDYSHWALGSQAYDIEANAIYTASKKFNVLFGAYYRELLHSYELLNMPSIGYTDAVIKQPDDVHLKRYSAFAQATVKPSDKLIIVGGLRLEKRGAGENTWEIFYGTPGHIFNRFPLEATKVNVIPRLAAIYSLNEKNIIKLLYGRAVRTPDYHERNDGFPLEPERIDTIELNYIAAFSSNFSLNLSLYRNMLDNLIYRREEFINGVYVTKQTNEGKMTTNGLEIGIKARPTTKFEVDLSLSYDDTTDKNAPDRAVTCSPKWLAYGKMAYNFTKDISLAMNAVYVDSMAAQWDAAVINPDGSTGARRGIDTPSYLNLGANLRIENLFGRGWYLGIKGYNLLNEDILYPTYSHSAWADRGTIGYGRMLFVTLGKKF